MNKHLIMSPLFFYKYNFINSIEPYSLFGLSTIILNNVLYSLDLVIISEHPWNTDGKTEFQVAQSIQKAIKSKYGSGAPHRADRGHEK